MNTIDFFKLEHFQQLKVSTELIITGIDVNCYLLSKHILLCIITRNMVGLETRPLKAFFFKGSRTTPYENFRIYLVRRNNCF